jgi:hypothetical protein
VRKAEGPAFPSVTGLVYPRLVDETAIADLKNVSNSTMTRMAFCGPRRIKDAKKAHGDCHQAQNRHEEAGEPLAHRLWSRASIVIALACDRSAPRLRLFAAQKKRSG